MNGTKIAVLGLSLLSLLIISYAALFAFGVALLDSSRFAVYQDPVTEKMNPGCMALPGSLIFASIALPPSLTAFWLWRRRIRSGRKEERRQSEEERQGERQFQQMSEKTISWLVERSTASGSEGRGNGGEAQKIFSSEEREWVQLWDRGRRERWFRFLCDLGLNGDWVVSGAGREPPRLAQQDPRPWRSLAHAGVVGWSCLSFLLFAFAVSAGVSMRVQAPSRPGEAVLGALGCFIPSLVTGAMAVGIGGLFWLETRAAKRRRDVRSGVREGILQWSMDQIQKLSSARSATEEAGGSRGAIRALALAALPELDAVQRGKLVTFLRYLGWLAGENRVHLDGANLIGAWLRGADLSASGLAGSDLSRADLSHADLEQSDLRGICLRKADLRFAKLHGADLCGADLRDAKLYQADLRGAKLEGTLLSSMALPRANLREGVLLHPHPDSRDVVSP